MKDFVIVTDSCSDLPLEYARNHEIDVVPLSFSINDKQYEDNLGASLSHEDFFKAIEEGAFPKTSLPSPDKFYSIFEKHIKEGKAVLYLGVSSEISGTYNSSSIAKQMIQDDYPDAKIVRLSTMIASVGQYLFIRKAVELKAQGKQLEEIVAILEKKVASQHNIISVNDLEYLKRGGRLTSLQTALGTLMRMNAIIRIDNIKGTVEFKDKIRGRKKAIKHIVNYTKTEMIHPEEQVVAIGHGNAYEEAVKIKEELLEALPLKEVVIHSFGPVIGSYSGAGGLAITFLN